MKTFTVNDSGTIHIRKHPLPNGKIIVFGIAGTYLSTINKEVDFDSKSDKLIEEHKGTKSNLVFECDSEAGFEKVPTYQQKWFSF